MNSKNLTHLNEGEEARVTGLIARGTMRRRLLDLGVINGTLIQCVGKNPAGDPVAYQIRGAIIALRSDDAKNIQI